MRGNGQIRTRKKLGERRREKRKKLFKGLGKLTLILSLIAGLAFAGKKAEDFLLTSHFFRIKEVNFKGATFLRQEVLEKLANIKLGKNIFRVNLRAIQERLERNPRVREAIISRAFPNAVTVNIREREAVALFESGGEAYPVDREGVVLPRLGRANPFSHSLPLIKGVKGYELKVGKKLQCPKLTVALELLAALASSGLKVNSYGINLGGPELILANKKTKVLLGELSTVKHGETPQSSAVSQAVPILRQYWPKAGKEKWMRELKLILSDLTEREEEAEYIDLRFSRPVVKLTRPSAAFRAVHRMSFRTASE